MLHPIYSTVLGHPELIADHLANYSALIKAEAAEAKRGLITRAIAGGVAAISALVALGLIGVAIMLGGMHQTFHWVLIVVPGFAILVAAIAAFVAARPSSFHGFQDLRAQLDADIHALHVAGARNGN
jgi:type IV secretory pathway VirB2 component (pilin)